MSDKPKPSFAEILADDVRGHLRKLKGAREVMRVLISDAQARHPDFKPAGFELMAEVMGEVYDSVDQLVEPERGIVP